MGSVNSTSHLARITRAKCFSRVAQPHRLHILCVVSPNMVMVSSACHVSHLARSATYFICTERSHLVLSTFPFKPDNHLHSANRALVWPFCRTVSTLLCFPKLLEYSPSAVQPVGRQRDEAGVCSGVGGAGVVVASVFGADATAALAVPVVVVFVLVFVAASIATGGCC